VAVPTAWSASRSRDWPVPIRTDSDTRSLWDSVALAFGSLSSGILLRASFRPLPVAPPPMRATTEPRPSERGRTDSRWGYDRNPSRAAAELDLASPTFWAVSARLYSLGETARVDRVAVAARAVESASRVSSGNGLTFHRMWILPSARDFFVSDAELALTAPSPECAALPAIDRLPDLARAEWALGRTFAGVPVGPAYEPAQGRHLAVLGESGMGKSSLLVSLCRRVGRRYGLILFDPLGETAESVRHELERSGRAPVVLIAPGNDGGLNALSGPVARGSPGGPAGERWANDLVHALRRVRAGRYEDASFWGPRLEEMLGRAITAAAAIPGATLEDAHALLGATGHSLRGVPPQAVPAVRELADRVRTRPEDAEGARRLLYEVVRSPVLLRAICAREPTVDLGTLLAPGRVVIISGDATEVGETVARYLLSVYLALVWSFLLARREAPKTFVVLDEAQWFAHEGLAEMLRLGRRRNVHVVLATQALAALPPAVREAAGTNVADWVAFRGSLDEARDIAHLAGEVSPDSVLGLPRGEAIVLLGKGGSVNWLRTCRLPAPITMPKPRDTHPAAVGVAVGGVPGTGPRPGENRAAVGLGELLERVDATETGALVRVSLAELESSVSGGPDWLRTAGGVLGRAAAIVRTERDEDGTVWWLDPARARPALQHALAEDSPERSRPPQPS